MLSNPAEVSRRTSRLKGRSQRTQSVGTKLTLQEESAVPEDDGPGEIKVQPEFEFIVGDVGDIGSADVDGEIRIAAEDLERIGGGTIGIDLVIGTQRDLDLQDLTGRDEAGCQQGIRSIAEGQEVRSRV